MKEKFENRVLTGNIKVTCKFEDGTTRIWETTKEEVVEHIIDIVDEYESDGYILTLRQIHYQFVKSNWIVNHDSAYKKLGHVLDDCKYAGLIDWENIEDRVRKPHIPYYVEDIADALQDTIDQYRIDRQDGQENTVELWTEKDAISGILKRITEKYHIRLVVNRGYTSSSALYQAYLRAINAIAEGKNYTILYFGDHDPSGLDMVRDIEDRLRFMMANGEHKNSIEIDNFEIKPIGLTMGQIKKYNLPPNPTKLTDSRAKGYIKQFGKTCWEVDALNPKTLTSIVESHIQKEINIELYNETVLKEKIDKETLKEMINNLE